MSTSEEESALLPTESEAAAGTSPLASKSNGVSAPDGASEPCAVYLAKRFVGEKSYRPGVPEEAAALVAPSDVVLSYSDFGLIMLCILDRESAPERRFAWSKQTLLDVGAACLKYTGTVNGAKMPVGISLFEVGSGPPTLDDITRLKALHKGMPGTSKVVITCYYLDTKNKTVWCSALLNGLFRQRTWLERLLREPRKSHEEMFVPEAVLPGVERRPFATAAVLGVLAVLFVVEQLADLGREASGLFGISVGTLFALGGMNADAVLEGHEWHRLLSAALLHGDALHLLLNGVALGMAGFVLESLIGRAWFISLFFIGALGGSLMGLLINSSEIVSVGASGAVMGLLAATLVVALRFPRGPERTQIQVSMLQFLLPSLLPLASFRSEGRIDYAAHFGGAIAGALGGFALMKLWPKTEAQPRFAKGAVGLALASVLSFGASLLLTNEHYPAHAATVRFSAKELLVDDGLIPEDFDRAKSEVEVWGKDRPRDPRVHLYRALHLLDGASEGIDATANDKRLSAERELRAALAEREIFERAFPNKKLETAIRSVLCELLLGQGRHDEARQEATPLCNEGDSEVLEQLKPLGLCD